MRLRNLIKAIVDLPSVTHEDNEVQLSTGQEVKELWLRGDGVVIIEVEEIKQDSEVQGCITDNNLIIGAMYQQEDTGLMQFVDQQQIEWGFEKNNKRLHKCYDVYDNRHDVYDNRRLMKKCDELQAKVDRLEKREADLIAWLKSSVANLDTSDIFTGGMVAMAKDVLEHPAMVSEKESEEFNPLATFNGAETLTEAEQIERLQTIVDRLEKENSDIVDNFSRKINRNHEDSTMLREANSALRSNLEKCMSYYRIELMKNSTPNYDPRNSAIFMGFQELLKSPNQEIAQCKDQQGGAG